MNDNALANVPKEGDNAFADMEKETPPESLPGTKPEGDEPAEGDVPAEDNVPFHKHPRWIERENELTSLREREEEMARELADLKAFREETSKKLETPTGVPEWFQELYGDNQVAWQKYSEHEQARTTELETRILSKQREEQTKQTQEAERWTKWVDEEIGKLESEGNTFDKNRLIQTMLEYRPTDENNNFDFKAGLKIYKALETKPDTAKSDARKALADTATATSTRGETPKKDYMTTAELRNRSMMSL